MLRRMAVVVLAGVAFSGCGGDESGPTTPTTPTAPLVIEDLAVGTGATAVTGDTVTVNYVGTLQNGAEFDNSYTSHRPFTFRLGAGQAIAGFDQGVTGMRVGGRRRLTIPPHLAYGSTGSGPIPPNATIRFEVELVAIAGR